VQKNLAWQKAEVYKIREATQEKSSKACDKKKEKSSKVCDKKKEKCSKICDNTKHIRFSLVVSTKKISIVFNYLILFDPKEQETIQVTVDDGTTVQMSSLPEERISEQYMATIWFSLTRRSKKLYKWRSMMAQQYKCHLCLRKGFLNNTWPLIPSINYWR
jgi:hypothetical protein